MQYNPLWAEWIPSYNRSMPHFFGACLRASVPRMKSIVFDLFQCVFGESCLCTLPIKLHSPVSAMNKA
eukprot:12111083-Ditylum_brightwellii.AAC.2